MLFPNRNKQIKEFFLKCKTKVKMCKSTQSNTAGYADGTFLWTQHGLSSEH